MNPGTEQSGLLARLEAVPRIHVRTSRDDGASDPREAADTLRRQLRAEGMGRGDALACVLPNGLQFAAAFLACLREVVTFVPISPTLIAPQLEERLSLANVSGVLSADGVLVRRRPHRVPPLHPTPTVILFTSGTGGSARAIALGEAGLLSVVDTHHRALGYPAGTLIVGCLPWSHAFGFTLEFLTGILKAAHLHSVAPASFGETVAAERPEVIFAVPRTLAALPADALSAVTAGIVGGAPIRGALRSRLERTRLRVGYGQTECSPGATLGEPGEFGRDGFLGRPLGCEVVLGPPDPEGARELRIRGVNTALASLSHGQAFPVVDAEGWLATGDLALPTPEGGFVFQGRRDERFKLSNGRMVNPVPLELPYGERILLIGSGQAMIQPLVRGEVPLDFSLPVPHRPPRAMPEAFWAACTTASGKLSRRRAEQLYELS